MMSKPTLSHFDSPREVIGWAEEGVDELDAACRAFFREDVFRKVTEFDEGTNQNIVKLKIIKSIPTNIARLTTEALNNLRHSFDQSVYAACRMLGKPTSKHLYFVWAESPADLDGGLGKPISRTNKTPQIPPELWPKLRTFEPYPRGRTYPGGNDLIRGLAKIANRKHTVRLDFAPDPTSVNYPSVTGAWKVEPGQTFRFPKPAWDAVKNEMILAVVPAGLKIHNDAIVAFNVAFDEAKPLKGYPIVPALREFLAKAKAVCEGLEREATRIATP